MYSGVEWLELHAKAANIKKKHVKRLKWLRKTLNYITPLKALTPLLLPLVNMFTLAEIDKATFRGLPRFHKSTIYQLIVAWRPPAASWIHFHEKKAQLGYIAPWHEYARTATDAGAVITNVAANYRVCHDTMIHEYSLLTDIQTLLSKRPLSPYYCLIVACEQVSPSCQQGTIQLPDKLFHQA